MRNKMKEVTLFKTYEQDESPRVYEKGYGQVLDLSKTAGIHLMSSWETLKEIKTQMDCQQVGPLSYLGEGGNHHLSLCGMMRIKEPFTLIVFDHHNDATPFPDSHYSSCGSWIQDAFSHIKTLKKAFIIGVSEENASQPTLKKELPITMLTAEAFSSSQITNLIETIPTETLYVSIDRDVFHINEVETSWDQGSLSLREGSIALERIIKGKKVIGGDICGDIKWEYLSSTGREYQKTREKSVEMNKQLFRILIHGLEERKVETDPHIVTSGYPEFKRVRYPFKGKRIEKRSKSD